MAIWQLALVKEVNFNLRHKRLKDSTQKIAGFLYKNSTARPLTARHTAEVCIICHLLCLPGNFLFLDSGMCDGITSMPPNCPLGGPFSKVLETFQAWKVVLCLSSWYSTSKFKYVSQWYNETISSQSQIEWFVTLDLNFPTVFESTICLWAWIIARPFEKQAHVHLKTRIVHLPQTTRTLV